MKINKAQKIYEEIMKLKMENIENTVEIFSLIEEYTGRPIDEKDSYMTSKVLED